SRGRCGRASGPAGCAIRAAAHIASTGCRRRPDGPAVEAACPRRRRGRSPSSWRVGGRTRSSRSFVSPDLTRVGKDHAGREPGSVEAAVTEGEEFNGRATEIGGGNVASAAYYGFPSTPVEECSTELMFQDSVGAPGSGQRNPAALRAG